ncbi:hypothetical protein ABTY59_31390 [Streptomyces sp. NPDC096079]|uniref:hypothetical protein n=1 Tax=Streptomyces sp. NPDC096079 TaxID=3155820 RepID=UPI00331C8CC3
MKSYAVQVHLYGSVAVVTLCARTDRTGGPASLRSLIQALAGIGSGVDSLVLDLDCAPHPVPADALAAIDRWAAGLEITLVILTPRNRRPKTRPPEGAALRAAPVDHARTDALGPLADEALVRQLQRVLGARALVHQAAGIRQARHHAHPCS